MRFDVLTIFPELFFSWRNCSIIKRAIENQRMEVALHDIRQQAQDKHRRVDDAPYGGGPGMLMMAPVLAAAIEAVPRVGASRVVMLSPQGERLTQAKLQEWAGLNQLVLVCGRYEGIDERVMGWVDETISIGDYVVNGGEVPAMVVMEGVARLLPNVLGNEASLATESHGSQEGEHPHYTRPETFRGLKVPPVLVSGDRAKIMAWRQQQTERRTRKKPR